jgi:6-phosphofructokinase
MSGHPALCIPMACIPATIRYCELQPSPVPYCSNNVPGTEVSLGCDTALNTVVEAIDRLVQSAGSSRSFVPSPCTLCVPLSVSNCTRRVFVVETMGGHCGYLATLGALAGGADDVLTHEEGVSIADLQADITHLRWKFKVCRFQLVSLFLRPFLRPFLSEMKTAAATTRQSSSQHVRIHLVQISLASDFVAFLHRCSTLIVVLREEGKHDEDLFSARSNILGHLQQVLYPYRRCAQTPRVSLRLIIGRVTLTLRSRAGSSPVCCCRWTCSWLVP